MAVTKPKPYATRSARKPATAKLTPTAEKRVATKLTAPTRTRGATAEQQEIMALLDETMARLDDGIARERLALDALLNKMNSKAA